MYEYLVAFRAGIGICDRLRVVSLDMSITEPTVRPGRGERFAVTSLSASKILWKPFMQSRACTALLPRWSFFMAFAVMLTSRRLVGVVRPIRAYGG